MTSDRVLFSRKASRPPSSAGNDTTTTTAAAAIKERHQAFNQYLVPNPFTGDYPSARVFWIGNPSRRRLIDANLIKVGYLNIYMSMPHQTDVWRNKKRQAKVMAALRAVMCFERYLCLGPDEMYYDNDHSFCMTTDQVLTRAAENPAFVHMMLCHLMPSLVKRSSVLLKCAECNKQESHPHQFTFCGGCGVTHYCGSKCRMAHSDESSSSEEMSDPPHGTLCHHYTHLIRHANH